MARTGLEAMQCGLPVILNAHARVCNFVKEGVNGRIVPIRNSGAIVEKVLFWGNKIECSVDLGVVIDADLSLLTYPSFSNV